MNTPESRTHLHIWIRFAFMRIGANPGSPNGRLRQGLMVPNHALIAQEARPVKLVHLAHQQPLPDIL